jgi:hypothetical protein
MRSRRRIVLKSDDFGGKLFVIDGQALALFVTALTKTSHAADPARFPIGAGFGSGEFPLDDQPVSGRAVLRVDTVL